MDIVREREIKRSLNYICSKELTKLIAPFSGIFFSRLFYLYGLIFNSKNIIKKRLFIQKAAKYFIFDRLSDTIGQDNNRYVILSPETAWDTVEKYMVNLETLIQEFSDVDDFIKKFSQIHNIEEKSFESSLAINIEGSLSTFDKTLKNLYYLERDNEN